MSTDVGILSIILAQNTNMVILSEAKDLVVGKL